jgi:type I restriction enzyme S subunit
MSKLKPYTTYQPVQYDYVSKLPEDWKLLPNIAIFRERIERGHENEELLSVTIGRGVIKQSELEKKDSSTLDKSKYLLLYPGDLVYSMRFRQGASGYSIYKGIVSPACTVLKPKKGIEINPRFFYYMFRTGFYKNYVERFAYGIADGQIPLRYVDFKRMYSIVPPLETQNAIVAYLDQKTQQIQEFIAKKERLIELLAVQLNAEIRELVRKGLNNTSLKSSHIDWIGEIPEHWEIKPLFSLFEEVKKKNDKKEDYKVLSLSYGQVIYKDHDSNFGLVPTNYDSYQIIEPNQLVFRFTDLQNDQKSLRVGLAKKKGIITSAYLSIRKKRKAKVNPDYFYYLLHFYDIEKVFYRFGGGVRQAMGMPDVKRLPLLLPPETEQNSIVTQIIEKKESILNSIETINTEIIRLKEYQESLITQIVTGQLKVPEKGNANLEQNIELGMVAEANGIYHSKH